MEDNKDLGLLVDISSVQIDTTLNKEDRIRCFIEKIKNPYHFRVDDVAVRISFKGEESTLQEKMHQYLETAVF